jgi:hypothetical protein
MLIYTVKAFEKIYMDDLYQRRSKGVRNNYIITLKIFFVGSHRVSFLYSFGYYILYMNTKGIVRYSKDFVSMISQDPCIMIDLLDWLYSRNIPRNWSGDLL